MSSFSAAGQVLVFKALDPEHADISPGLAWALIVANSTGADITAGGLKLQSAAADPNNPCSPDDATWADVQVAPECDAAPGTVAAPAKIAYTPQNPLKANSQCQYAVPCLTGPFIRAVGDAVAPAGADVWVVVTRLRRINY